MTEIYENIYRQQSGLSSFSASKKTNQVIGPLLL